MFYNLRLKSLCSLGFSRDKGHNIFWAPTHMQMDCRIGMSGRNTGYGIIFTKIFL